MKLLRKSMKSLGKSMRSLKKINEILKEINQILRKINEILRKISEILMEVHAILMEINETLKKINETLNESNEILMENNAILKDIYDPPQMYVFFTKSKKFSRKSWNSLVHQGNPWNLLEVSPRPDFYDFHTKTRGNSWENSFPASEARFLLVSY